MKHFWKGFFSAFNIFPITSVKDVLPKMSDEEASASDWKAVGDDMRKVMDDVGNVIDKNK